MPPGAAALAADEAPTEPAARPADTPFRSRFGLLLGGLPGLAIATLAIGAAVFAGTTRDGVPEGWSGWRPTADDGEKAAAQIADHVGHKYRLADDSQLVGIEGGRLEIDALGLTVPLEIAMRTAPQGGASKLIEGDGLLYNVKLPRAEG